MECSKTLRLLLLASPLTGVLAGCDREPPPGGVTATKASDPAAQDAESRYAYVRLATTMGAIVLELDRTAASLTARNFLQYVDEGFYDGTLFHRVVPDWVIQAGGLRQDHAQGALHPPIPNEATNGIENRRGTVAMARSRDDPHSATSHFFINVKTNPELNFRKQSESGWGYCVFGKVIAGMDVVDRISQVPVRLDPRVDADRPAAPETPIVITKAERVDPAEVAAAIEVARMDEASERSRREAAEKRTEERREKDHESAVAFLAGLGVDVARGEFTPSGLWMLETEEGAGSNPSRDARMQIHYRCWLPDGTLSRTTRKKDLGPANVTFATVSPGLREALQTMRPGGRRYLILTPELASRPPRPGSKAGIEKRTLIFELDLLGIEEG